MKLYTFKKGGVHPPESKLTAGKPIIDVELPRKVVLSMSQAIGAPAKCELKKGDKVKRGDVIGVAGGFVSANVHTPISGTVDAIGNVLSPQGTVSQAVTIVADDADHFADLQAISDAKPVRTDADIEALTPEQITAIIGDAGIVGLGGATFPTRVKLTPPPGCVADILIINGAECEPYLTCDQAIMLAQAPDIIEGTLFLMKAAKVERAVIAIENNKPDAIAIITDAARRYPQIEVAACRTKYPQGSEKQLIAALTGREVASGALPISVGAIVDNVATVLAVYHAVRWGLPLMERVLTITGKKVSRPGNFRVPLGTSMLDLAELAGGIPENTGKIIIGGPMMGRTAVSLDSPSTKGTSGILFMDESESYRREADPCVRCAKCVDACPMGLEPYLLSILGSQRRFDEADQHSAADCIECGCCTFTCPSARPLLDNIRLAKQTILARRRMKK